MPRSLTFALALVASACLLGHGAHAFAQALDPSPLQATPSRPHVLSTPAAAPPPCNPAPQSHPIPPQGPTAPRGARPTAGIGQHLPLGGAYPVPPPAKPRRAVPVRVKAHRRRDGSFVPAHTRGRPDGKVWNNRSFWERLP